MGQRGRLLHSGEMARNFTIIFYPEHITELDLDIYLEELGVKCARSPLHDKDTYTKSSVRKWEKSHPNPTEEELANKPVLGALKKPHWHVSFQLSGRRKQENILKLFEPEMGVTSVWKDYDPEYAIRYLCHLDSKDKTKYPIKDVVDFGGIDISGLEKLTKLDKVNVIAVVCEHVQKEHVTNFYDLSNWVMEQGDVDMFDALVSKTAFFINYMSGYERKQSMKAYNKNLPKYIKEL